MIEHTTPSLTSISGRSLCPHTHTQKRDGHWQRGDAPEATVLVTLRNGVQQTKLQCSACGKTTGALPADVAARWDLAAPAQERRSLTDVTCSVMTCDSHHVELHHFAPRNVFTDEADDWPVMPLCRDHHQEWHRRMDGYRWHRKAVA